MNVVQFPITPNYPSHLKLIDLILRKSQPGKDPLILRSDQRLLHTGRTADKDMGILARLTDDIAQQLLSHISLAQRGSFFSRAADSIEIIEAIRESSLEFLQLISEQQILLGIHAEDEVNLGLIFGVIQDALEELVDRCDSGPAGNHVHLREFVGGPWESLQSGGEGERVAGLEGVQVAALFAIGVFLD